VSEQFELPFPEPATDPDAFEDDALDWHEWFVALPRDPGPAQKPAAGASGDDGERSNDPRLCRCPRPLVQRDEDGEPRCVTCGRWLSLPAPPDAGAIRERDRALFRGDPGWVRDRPASGAPKPPRKRRRRRKP
jgi:hypothetical protein